MENCISKNLLELEIDSRHGLEIVHVLLLL